MHRKIVCLCFFMVVALKGFSKDIANGWPFFESPQAIRGDTFLITPGYSGSHYLCFTLAKLTQRPICYISANASDPLRKKLTPASKLIQCDLTKRPFFWGHRISKIQFIDSNHNQLIMSFRNYKEKLSRDLIAQLGSRNLTEKDIEELDYISFLEDEVYNEKRAFRELIQRLALFDQWNDKNKLFLYYEDLVADPEANFKKILDFLGESPQRLASLMANFESHKQSVIDYYENIRKARSVTKGEDFLFYSKKMPQNRLQKIDAYVARKYPILWQKYLSRYDSFNISISVQNLGD